MTVFSTEVTFVTKRDRNGNRYYLTVDLVNKTFSRVDRWYRSDFITVTRRDKNRIVATLKSSGYTEIDG